MSGVLSEIADVAGEAAAVALAAQYGGTRVYIPARAGDGHWLVACVGRRAADLICAHFVADGSGQRIEVPLAGGGSYPQLRRTIARRVHELDREGKSEGVIAKAVGVTGRTVRRHRAAHRGSGKDSKQGSLF